MPTLVSKLDTKSAEFSARRAQMLALIDEFRAAESRVDAHGNRARPKFAEHGRLIPRERVERLLDPGAPFLELSTLAGYRMHDDNGRDETHGGGSIAGVGFVRGLRCVVVASDSAIKGGTITPMGLRKTLRAQEIALENRLPIVSLIESGGANLLHQSELFVPGGSVFYNMARMSAAGVIQITVVHGSSTAGGAYMPGLSDYVVMVRDWAHVFLAGPPLVKAAIGEDADEAALGGALMHAEVTGSAEYLADDDAHALRIVRELVAKLPFASEGRPTPPPHARPPRYDIDELCGLVPVDPRHPYDPRELVARLVDDSDFLEFKPAWGSDTVCGHAAIDGMACGIVANAGPIHPQGSAKAAQFIQLCCQARAPIVYLQNTTGYMVGSRAEQEGAVKHGSRMIQAVANATVPQITLVVGGGFGAGNYGMCGRAFRPRFIFAWPNSRVAVMGGSQAGTVMETITRAKFARRGTAVDEAALAQMRDSIVAKLDGESRALFATARLWDDGIIDPRDSRSVLAFCLATCREAEWPGSGASTFGVARS